MPAGNEKPDHPTKAYEVGIVVGSVPMSIDAESLPLIEEGHCHIAGVGKGAFVSFWNSRGNHVPLRRLIMGVEGAGFNVRHLNDDPLDCRRENLVVRTIRQRTRNMRKAMSIKGRPPTSRFKGVYWHKATKRWQARITVDGKDRRLGRFGDEISAAVAYDEAAQLWFGEHARLNFPDGVDAWLEAEAEREAEHSQSTDELMKDEDDPDASV